VSARQGERRVGVVERCALPAGCSVTQAAILREAGCLVVWSLGISEIREVAGCTGGRKAPRNLAILVALRALQRLVSPG
jgi:hypothetical protein